MRPDKEKVVDEIWDDERIDSFLNKLPMGAESNPDYSMLLNAYRSMRPADFARFCDKFAASGHDVNARSNDGLTLLDTIADHRQATPFREILIAHGALGQLSGH